MQIFLTGPTGSGKTFTIRLLMEIYNTFTINDGYCYTYITCGSTGHASVAIKGGMIHTTFKITQGTLHPLSIESIYLYRSLFKFVKVVIIDECSMIGVEMLSSIDSWLKQIIGNYQVPYRGLDIIFIGDLRQLPPVRATLIYKQKKQNIADPMLWRVLKFYGLGIVMRQEDRVFSWILTKTGDELRLNSDEQTLIKSRMFSKKQVNVLCLHGLRLFH